MKVSGPKGPAPVPPPSEQATDKPPSAAAASFREVLQAPATSPPQSPLRAAFDEIQTRLRAGEIDAARASEMLVETVVRAQLPQAAPRLQEQLRETLQKLLREDPVLSAKLRELAEGER